MINEDPNYYIKKKIVREQVHLFDDKGDEFDEDENAEIKGKIIREGYIKEQKRIKRDLEMQRLEKVEKE